MLDLTVEKEGGPHITDVGTTGATWPLVADVVFYGDMTAYGLSFTDESGIQRHFAITMSGFDSSLVATEYH